MNCEEFENRILDYQDNHLSTRERESVEQHLTSCPNCQAFARQLQQLDAALTRTAKAPTLPADFKVRLQRRIQSETVVLSEMQRAERKRQMQAEYETGLARLGRQQLGFTSWIGPVCYGLLAGVAGWFIWQLTPMLTALLAQPSFSIGSQSSMVLFGIGALFLVAGMMVAFSQNLQRTLALR